MTPELREAKRQAGRMGALTRLSREDAHDIAAPARAGFLAKFEREVDPDGTLDPKERARRADAAMRLHMARIRLKRKKAA